MRKQLMVEHIIHKFELELDLNIDEQELYLQLQNQNYSEDENDEIFSNSFNNEIDLIPSQNIQVNSQNVNQTSTQSYQKLQKSIENKAQINDKIQENVAKKQQQFQEKDNIMTLLSLVQRQKNSQDSMSMKNNNSKDNLYEKQDSVVSNGLKQFQKSIFKNFDKSPIKYKPSSIIKEDNIDN
ncbi:hypothetical protein PPERSA_03510 [Pseudocohnilembus persalinus]|uniref:Uncharacterized protein n=1 Tax=Pseudocohnilembus persalinus TaxID=266149 RepID=A0A0V0R298_PSEPJ|nr:hypothetical protein PPERSA_03510 [Pseudocohnilembus persalinus]|eukprot:KRX08639.1 hypothetical protein PPERSA_03510 [Pseudocohnilembus persalinus]